MNIIIREIDLIKRYVILSFKEYLQFPFDFVMNFVMLLFDVSTLVLFWYSLINLGVVIENWNNQELFIFVALNLFSEAISKITFGFRDLEFNILNGKFDKYMIRPIGVIKSLLLERLNIFAIVTKIIISIILICIIKVLFQMKLYYIFWAFISLIAGTLAFELLYGCVTLLAFWVGKIYTAREIVFSFHVAKKYPIDIFPKALVRVFTFIVPLAFMATIPTKIVLGKETHYIAYTALSILLFVLVLLLFKLVLKRALDRYNSAGC